jgi:hypothetical protein
LGQRPAIQQFSRLSGTHMMQSTYEFMSSASNSAIQLFEWNSYDARAPVNLCQHQKLGNIFMVLLQWLQT